jgi:hypothetical protein
MPRAQGVERCVRSFLTEEGDGDVLSDEHQHLMRAHLSLVSCVPSRAGYDGEEKDEQTSRGTRRGKV